MECYATTPTTHYLSLRNARSEILKDQLMQNVEDVMDVMDVNLSQELFQLRK